MPMDFKKVIYIFIFIFISSCRFFDFGPTLIYEHAFNASPEIIDSACTIFMNKHNEHQISDTTINRMIKNAKSKKYKENMTFYMRNKYYYPFAPRIMNKYYLCKSENENLYYWFVVADLDYHNSIQLIWVKKDSLNSKSISHYSLPRREEKIIKEKFKNEIINKIEVIVFEIK